MLFNGKEIDKTRPIAESGITYGSNIELVYENIVFLCQTFQLLGR